MFLLSFSRPASRQLSRPIARICEAFSQIRIAKLIATVNADVAKAKNRASRIAYTYTPFRVDDVMNFLCLAMFDKLLES